VRFAEGLVLEGCQRYPDDLLQEEEALAVYTSPTMPLRPKEVSISNKSEERSTGLEGRVKEDVEMRVLAGGNRRVETRG
jgi:hypothetical protein